MCYFLLFHCYAKHDCSVGKYQSKIKQNQMLGRWVCRTGALMWWNTWLGLGAATPMCHLWTSSEALYYCRWLINYRLVNTMSLIVGTLAWWLRRGASFTLFPFHPELSHFVLNSWGFLGLHLTKLNIQLPFFLLNTLVFILVICVPIYLNIQKSFKYHLASG